MLAVAFLFLFITWSVPLCASLSGRALVSVLCFLFYEALAGSGAVGQSQGPAWERVSPGCLRSGSEVDGAAFGAEGDVRSFLLWLPFRTDAFLTLKVSLCSFKLSSEVI